MDRRVAGENLVAAVEALAAHGVRAFLVDGTLLGAVREGDFLAHDHDVDLGVFAEDYSPILLQALQARGFVVWRIYGSPERGLQFSLKRQRQKLDVFFYYADEVERYHAAWKDGEPIRYGYPRFALAAFEFLGRTWWAPAEPEAFCATKYGTDWRVPVTTWDWAWGPRNAVAWR